MGMGVNPFDTNEPTWQTISMSNKSNNITLGDLSFNKEWLNNPLNIKSLNDSGYFKTMSPVQLYDFFNNNLTQEMMTNMVKTNEYGIGAEHNSRMLSDYVNKAYGNIDDVQRQNFFNKYNEGIRNGQQFDFKNGVLSVYGADGKVIDTLGTLEPSAMDKAAQGMSIFGSTMQGLNSLSQIGLGWANYAENRERLKQLNELTKEQIASSREMREQRRKEIERLNKARTYTKNAYGKGTTITRSVM